MPRSLVVQTSFIGDMVLTTPLIAALSRRGPVDVVATPANATLLANNPLVRRLFRYDKRREHSGVSGFREMVRATRAEGNDDEAYLAQGSLRSAALALAAGYRTRVGFDTSAGRLFYTERVPYRGDRHHAERLWSLGRFDRAAGADELRPRLYPGPDDEAAVDTLLADHDFANEPLLALAPGSVWATKRWPHYPALAKALSAIGRVVVVGGSDDTTLAQEIVHATNGTAIVATGRLTLLASAALIARTRILVTNDSAPQHLASATNTPTVSIFGPTVPQFGFGPLASPSRVAEVTTLDCRPCDRHGPPVCPLGHWRCMRELEVVHVQSMVEQVVRDAAGRSA